MRVKAADVGKAKISQKRETGMAINVSFLAKYATLIPIQTITAEKTMILAQLNDAKYGPIPGPNRCATIGKTK